MLKGFAAYSRDGRLLAMAHSNRAVRVVEAHSHQEIARLDAQEALLISGICFSPDGGRLAVATENHVVQLWDLRQIHRQLAALDLAWTPAWNETEPPPGSAPVALRLRLDDEDEQAARLLASAEESLGSLTELIETHPHSPKLHYRRGVRLAEQGKIEQALSDFQVACRLQPSARHLEALGWMQLGSLQSRVEKARPARPTCVSFSASYGGDFGKKFLPRRSLALGIDQRFQTMTP